MLGNGGNLHLFCETAAEREMPSTVAASPAPVPALRLLLYGVFCEATTCQLDRARVLWNETMHEMRKKKRKAETKTRAFFVLLLCDWLAQGIMTSLGLAKIIISGNVKGENP